MDLFSKNRHVGLPRQRSHHPEAMLCPRTTCFGWQCFVWRGRGGEQWSFFWRRRWCRASGGEAWRRSDSFQRQRLWNMSGQLEKVCASASQASSNWKMGQEHYRGWHSPWMSSRAGKATSLGWCGAISMTNDSLAIKQLRMSTTVCGGHQEDSRWVKVDSLPSRDPAFTWASTQGTAGAKFRWDQGGRTIGLLITWAMFKTLMTPLWLTRVLITVHMFSRDSYNLSFATITVRGDNPSGFVWCFTLVIPYYLRMMTFFPSIIEMDHEWRCDSYWTQSPFTVMPSDECLPNCSFPRLKMLCTSRRENSNLDEGAPAHRVPMGSYEGLWHVTWFNHLVL